MKTYRDEISGVFLIFLSIVACVSAYQLGLGSMSNPGAGTIAFGIGVLMGILSLGLIITSVARRREKAADAAAPAAGGYPIRPLLTLALLVVYGVILPWIGFIASTFLVMMALLWGIGRQKLMLSLAVSIATAVAAYLLFVTLFSLPFPQGNLWLLMER
jgi:hypothetical protein